MASPLDEVLEALQALLDARHDAPVPAEAGRGNFRCEGCVDCSHCRFCTDCTACEDCTYCEGCNACTSCTHCKHCLRCKQTTHSTWSSECSDSSYLTLCLDCEACVQCFACVGLQREEFCVLNEKLPRKAYFSRVAALRGALEERLAAGWRPPWEPVVEDAPQDDAPQDDAQDDAPQDEAPQEPPPLAEPAISRSLLLSYQAEQTPLRIPSPTPESTRAELLPMHRASEPVWHAEKPVPSMASPIRRERSEITADIVEPQSFSRPSRNTPPWSFADVRRGRNPPVIEDDGIPEPPPFGSGPHPAAKVPADLTTDPGAPRASNEAAGARERVLPQDSPRDRYGWSAQAEGTPVRLGWSVQAEGEPERLSWSTAAEEEPVRRRESSASRWGSIDEGSDRWSRSKLETDDRASVPKAWNEPPPRPLEPDEPESDRRRRETAASPSATPLGPEDLPIVHGRDLVLEREPDARSVYDAARRSRLGPEERTEPDAPVPRRGSSRSDLGRVARGLGDLEDPARRQDTRATPSAVGEQAEARASSRSLGVARRPERPHVPEPHAPEPRAREGGALLRGRAPARPAPPAPARQPDAPSLRRARRPSRTRDELPTSEYLAVDDTGDDPERS